MNQALLHCIGRALLHWGSLVPHVCRRWISEGQQVLSGGQLFCCLVIKWKSYRDFCRCASLASESKQGVD